MTSADQKIVGFETADVEYVYLQYRDKVVKLNKEAALYSKYIEECITLDKTVINNEQAPILITPVLPFNDNAGEEAFDFIVRYLEFCHTNNKENHPPEQPLPYKIEISILMGQDKNIFQDLFNVETDIKQKYIHVLNIMYIANYMMMEKLTKKTCALIAAYLNELKQSRVKYYAFINDIFPKNKEIIYSEEYEKCMN